MKTNNEPTRQEHLKWCKQRALQYVDAGDNARAMVSMASDLNKHDGTRDRIAVSLGMQLLMAGYLSSAKSMKEFIEGFN